MSEMPVEAHGDHVHAHARRTGHRWFDVTMAVAAIFISVVSLYVAVEHGRTERDLVAASSWPFPQVMTSDGYRNGQDITFGISNSGTGPAKIYSVEVAYDGRPIASPVDLLRRCCGAPADAVARQRVLPEGSLQMQSVDYSVLRPGEEAPMLLMHRNQADRTIAARFASALPRLTFRSCYCSVLGECWVSSMQKLETTRVRACEAPAHPYYFSNREAHAALSMPRSPSLR